MTTSWPKRLLLLTLVSMCVWALAAVQVNGQTRFPTKVSIVINEILASNRSAVQDPQRDYDDWLELYNGGPAAVDVAGMYLTDDASAPTRWQFPSGQPEVTTIPAHGFLLVWADGDTTSPGLHANFKLDADGEELSLIATDGTTVIDSIEFGEQVVDVSYGRYPDGDPNLRHMSEPTPGQVNAGAYEGIAETPEFSHTGSLCSEPVTVTLATQTPGATIYYTLDGQAPYSISRDRPGGFTYSQPIQVTNTTTIKAISWLPGWRQSRVHTERYSFVDASMYEFSSPLPIAVVDMLGAGVSTSQKPTYSYVIDTDRTGRATLTKEADFAGWAGLNIRGKSSEGFSKKQYRFETWDEDGRDEAISILGFPAESDWVLQGPYSDKSLMRNVLAYRWSNDLGEYAPRTRLIEMFLKTDNSRVSMSDYVGVYVLMEKIKIASDRVDIAELRPSDEAVPEVTGGYILKKDKYDGGDVSFRTSTGLTLIYDDPDGQDLTEAQKDWIEGYIRAFEGALYGPNFQDPIEGYAAYIDMDAFIGHHIIVEMCKNIDGFRISTFMHKDRNGKLRMGPVWDYNLSLGNANYLAGWIPSGWYHNQIGGGDYPWWRRLFEDPEFRLRYADRWFGARRTLFTTERLLGIVDDYAALLEEPQTRNFDRWRILGRYVWPNWYIADTYQEEIAWMKDWLADRLTWMDGQIASEMAPPPPTFSQQGGHVEEGFALEMASPSGTIYYTLDGSDPRPSDPGSDPALGTVLVAENAPKRVLVPARPIDEVWQGGSAFDDSAWTLVTGNPGGVGYEQSTGYESFFALDVQSQMYGQQTSCYLRIPFTMTQPVSQLETVTLRVRYDDGFIAYFNGIEIARRNIVGDPSWDASADDQHFDMDAVSFESIEIADFPAALRRADNMLAIHALNVSATSSDFLISAELVATAADSPDDTASSIMTYVDPVVLEGSAQVKARARIGGAWTALNEATFAVGPVAESLRISELMYHPAETGSPDDPNTEYVELTNIGTEAIDLNLVRFTDGIDFTFPAVELAPGDYILVVEDVAAFEAKYGSGLPLAGQYVGSLSNAGERLQLQDAAGRTIHDFSYQDDWYDATDEEGYSLVVLDPVNTPAEGWADKSTWGPSAEAGGSPGSDEAQPLL